MGVDITDLEPIINKMKTSPASSISNVNRQKKESTDWEMGLLKLSRKGEGWEEMHPGLQCFLHMCEECKPSPCSQQEAEQTENQQLYRGQLESWSQDREPAHPHRQVNREPWLTGSSETLKWLLPYVLDIGRASCRVVTSWMPSLKVRKMYTLCHFMLNV